MGSCYPSTIFSFRVHIYLFELTAWTKSYLIFQRLQQPMVPAKTIRSAVLRSQIQSAKLISALARVALFRILARTSAWQVSVFSRVEICWGIYFLVVDHVVYIWTFIILLIIYMLIGYCNEK
jgi:hypothetical protein